MQPATGILQPESRNRLAIRRGGLLAALFILLFPAIASACPGCSEGLDGNLIRGYFWSIIFMMSMPFLIFGGLSSYMYLEVRRARARQLDRECGADDPDGAMTGQRRV